MIHALNSMVFQHFIKGNVYVTDKISIDDVYIGMIALKAGIDMIKREEFKFYAVSIFLGTTNLQRCLTVGRLVCWSVGPSVRPSVGSSVFLLILI